MARRGRWERHGPVSPALLALALGAALAASAAFAAPAAGESLLERADALWEGRAEGCGEDGRARRELADAAIEAYQRAVDADPTALHASWKLVRALYFAADYAAGEPGDPLRLLERANRESARAFGLLATRLGVSGRPGSFTEERLRRLAPAEAGDAAGVFFWSAVAWGAWSRYHGAFEAVSAGVADRLYYAALAVLALDPSFEEAGAHRLLARIHAEVPRIPFYTGWVDRELAVPAAERAVMLAPGRPANRFLLAITLLEVAPERRAEAVRLLDEAARSEPRPGQRAEDLAARHAARERLARELGEPRYAGDVASGPPAR